MQNYAVVRSHKFEKARRKLQSSQGFDSGILKEIIRTLSIGVILEPKYRDHFLAGEWQGYRECHVKSDLLLIYKIDKELKVLILADIGSHSQLFG